MKSHTDPPSLRPLDLHKAALEPDHPPPFSQTLKTLSMRPLLHMASWHRD
jgi:hypothetical protein